MDILKKQNKTKENRTEKSNKTKQNYSYSFSVPRFGKLAECQNLRVPFPDQRVRC